MFRLKIWELNIVNLKAETETWVSKEVGTFIKPLRKPMWKCELSAHFLACGSFKLVWIIFQTTLKVITWLLWFCVVFWLPLKIGEEIISLSIRNKQGIGVSLTSKSSLPVKPMNDWFGSQYQVFKVAISFTFAPHPYWFVKTSKEPCEFHWFWLFAYIAWLCHSCSLLVYFRGLKYIFTCL